MTYYQYNKGCLSSGEVESPFCRILLSTLVAVVMGLLLYVSAPRVSVSSHVYSILTCLCDPTIAWRKSGEILFQILQRQLSTKQRHR